MHIIECGSPGHVRHRTRHIGLAVSSLALGPQLLQVLYDLDLQPVQLGTDLVRQTPARPCRRAA